MNALEELLSDLKEVCAGLDDKRVGPGYRYTMADIGLAAFSVFFMQSPSFLGHQRTLAEGHGPIELPDPVRYGGDSERQPHPPDARRHFARRLRRAVPQGGGER